MGQNYGPFLPLWPKKNQIRTIFRRLWTKVESLPNFVGMYGSDLALFNVVFRSSISYSNPEIRDHVVKFSEIAKF